MSRLQQNSTCIANNLANSNTMRSKKIAPFRRTLLYAPKFSQGVTRTPRKTPTGRRHQVGTSAFAWSSTQTDHAKEHTATGPFVNLVIAIEAKRVSSESFIRRNNKTCIPAAGNSTFNAETCNLRRPVPLKVGRIAPIHRSPSHKMPPRSFIQRPAARRFSSVSTRTIETGAPKARIELANFINPTVVASSGEKTMFDVDGCLPAQSNLGPPGPPDGTRWWLQQRSLEAVHQRRTRQETDRI